jgi:propionyl-CoA synthetase
VLRELLENAVHGDIDKEVSVPSTVEDAGVVEVARGKVKEYFEARGTLHGSIERRAKL